MDILNRVLSFSFDNKGLILVSLLCLTILILLSALISRFGRSYTRRGCILTKTEQASFLKFERAVSAKNHRLFAQVRVADVVQVKGRKGRGWWRKFVKISSKHVDFVVTNKSFDIVAAIEVDDSSHQRSDRKKRDVFLDRVFKEAGLPLIRVEPGRESSGIENLMRLMK